SAPDPPGTSRTLPVGILTISKNPLSAPVPLSGMVVWPPFASLGTLSDAERLPANSGIKVTVIVQLALGANVPLQSFHAAKSSVFVPVTVMFAIGIFSALVLLTVKLRAVLRVTTF